MITISEFKAAFQGSEAVSIAIVGDSTTAGFGANPGPNTWTNGISYGCVNNPTFGPNWDNSSPYVINPSGLITQGQQDNTGIPSGVRLLRTWVESANSASKVYNYGAAGWTAGSHVSNGTIAALAALSPKPQVVFLSLGINSAKNNLGQDTDLRTLVSQCISNNMLPVLVKENNVGVAGSTSGNWSDTATPDNWYPMDNWPNIRSNIDTIASYYGLEIVDLGTSDCALDITKLYDPFHPNYLGYQDIYMAYRGFLGEVTTTTTAAPEPNGAVRFNGDETHYNTVENGPLKIKVGGSIISLHTEFNSSGTQRYKTSLGVAYVK